MRKLILKSDLSPGDIVMLTAAVRDLHGCHPHEFLTDVRTHCPALWHFNPHLTALEDDDPEAEFIECRYPLINRANRLPHHCLHGYISFLNEELGLAIELSAFKGDIHMSPAETQWASQVHELTDTNLPFWLLTAGGKTDVTIKWWDAARYQKVVDAFRGRILFVQVGRARDHHPALRGVIDLRGRTNLRQLVRLVYHAQGVISPVTAVMHLAAAVPTQPDTPPLRPCVVIAGGREPVHWESYPGHQFIHTIGALPCCRSGGCWKARTVPLGDGDSRDDPKHLCVNVAGDLPRCMDLITAEEVVRRVELYFAGGTLRYQTQAEARISQRAVSNSPRATVQQLKVANARAMSEKFLRSLPSAPRTTAERGIVICGGGVSYFPSAWVTIRMLRHLGCTLPIQLWHLDRTELSPEMAQLVAPFGVECRDASKVRERYPVRQLQGWELKPYAMLYSPFRDVLLIDADNLPVRNPEFLFDTVEFRRTGAVFWPDYGRLDKDRAIWKLCGVRYRDEPEFETGQILLDKTKCWAPLRLCMWYNEHSDFFYNYIHGDKDTFHMAWRKLRQRYAMPARPIEGLSQMVMCQHDFQGRRIFQHRNLDKWRLHGRNAAIPDFWFEAQCREWMGELRRAWKGTIVERGGSSRSPTERRYLGELSSQLYEYQRVGTDKRSMSFLPNGLVGVGAARCETYWSLRVRKGRAVLTLRAEKETTCRLVRTADGVWRGRWLHYERMPVELSPCGPSPAGAVFPQIPKRSNVQLTLPPRIQPVMISCSERDRVRAETMRCWDETDWSGPKMVLQLDDGKGGSHLERIRKTARRALESGLRGQSDYVLFLEDDLDFNRALHQNLSAWPPLRHGQITLASLYNPSLPQAQPDPAWNGFIATSSRMFGSQAYLISREATRYILHHWDDEAVADLMPDLKMPRLAHRLGQPIYYHQPSLVQHTGQRSVWGGHFHRASDFDRWWVSPHGRQPEHGSVDGARPCLVSVVSAPAQHYDLYWRSCARWNLQPIILGSGRPYPGHAARLKMLRQFLNEAGDRFTHLVFSDAYDVVWSAGWNELLERFATFGRPIVFSAERNCFPDSSLRRRYPRTSSPYKYLNGGFWMAEIPAARELLNEMDDAMLTPNTMDQQIFAQMFVDGDPRLALDYSSLLCQSLCQAGDDLRYDAALGRIVNRLTGSAPAAFHGNGGVNMKKVFRWLKLS